jgi:hypothetical protein
VMLSASWRNFPYSPAQGIFGFKQGKLFALAEKVQGKAARSVGWLNANEILQCGSAKRRSPTLVWPIAMRREVISAT